MSKRSKILRLAAVMTAIAMLVTACGDDAESTTTAATATTEATTATTSNATETTEAAQTTITDAASVGDLSTCPNPIVIQTGWFPESEYGPLFQLTGGEGAIDGETGRFQGPLTADPSITVEIRAGGPYVGFTPANALMYADDELFLGLTPTDTQLSSFDSIPVVAVMAMLEKSPLGIMFDPEINTFESVADVGESGVVVNYFKSALWPDFFIHTGQLSADQMDGSYDGSQVRFISEEGAIAQQAFATHEPWDYENTFTEFGDPVEVLLLHDSGFEYYEQQLAIRADRLEESAECLRAFVPLVQQASVDFMNDPSAANAAIVQATVDLQSFWHVSPEAAAWTVQMMDELGIVANGSDGILGNFDLDRLDALIDDVRDISSFNVTTQTAADLVTNQFIDPTIGR